MRLYASEWEFDIYGKFRTFAGRFLNDCPFRYQGQYEDSETGLYYNRFRYYDPSTRAYISQDPIGLAGNNPTLYGYVCDSNTEFDSFGLDCGKATSKTRKNELLQSQRKYRAMIGGKQVNGIADRVVDINGRNVTIEAKYVKDWSKSIRNPNSKIGNKQFAIAEQQKMLLQAQKYSNAFDEVIYHTNSQDLAILYTKIFQDAGLSNVKINITP